MAKPQDIRSASINTAKLKAIKKTKKKIWMKECSESDKGRNIFDHMPSPNPNDSINQLKRNEQVTILLHLTYGDEYNGLIMYV